MEYLYHLGNKAIVYRDPETATLTATANDLTVQGKDYRELEERFKQAVERMQSRYDRTQLIADP